eukprot:00977_3
MTCFRHMMFSLVWSCFVFFCGCASCSSSLFFSHDGASRFLLVFAFTFARRFIFLFTSQALGGTFRTFLLLIGFSSRPSALLLSPTKGLELDGRFLEVSGCWAWVWAWTCS